MIAGPSPQTKPSHVPLVDARELAAYLRVAVGYVYENAARLGARRLGDGPRARLRFSLAEVEERLSACSASRGSVVPEPAPRVASRSRPRRRMGTSIELLRICT
jgi:hypothetical protein